MTARNRTRNVTGRAAVVHRRVNGVSVDSDSQLLGTSDESMDDHVVPNFHARSAAGEVINNPLGYVKETFDTTGPGYYNAVIGGSSYEADGNGSITSGLAKFLANLGQSNQVKGYLAPAVCPASFEDEAKAKALGNVDRSPYAFGEDLGELGETLRFLKDPAKALRDLSQEFSWDVSKLFRKQKYKDRAKAIANVWTMYRFAFSPVVRSAHDLIKAFGEKTNRPKRRTARGFSAWSESDSDAEPSGYWTWARSVSATADFHAGVLYEVSNPFTDWRYKYGLRFKDIPETVWQLLPYSFMVDRVWNLSQAIRGTTAFLDPNVEILTAFVTRRDELVQTRSCVDYTYPVESLTFTPDVDTKTKSSVTRTPWTPSIGEAVPGLHPANLVNDATKVADLFALILQRVK